ncbi:MAG: hypothetical protein LQ340_002157 [Diploschistes diacapsis]|nr:MAG: hypothetical protein LQ340_002157 [Diploschistes diacapsis]
MDLPLRLLSLLKRKKETKGVSQAAAAKVSTSNAPSENKPSSLEVPNPAKDHDSLRQPQSGNVREPIQIDHPTTRQLTQCAQMIPREPVTDRLSTKTAVANLTAQRLQEISPDFNPDSLGRPVRDAVSTGKTPSITISDESSNTQNIPDHQELRDSLKPMPDIPIPTSTRRRCSTATSSTGSSTSSRNIFRVRSISVQSDGSTFSQWSQPSSTCSLLPPPLNITKTATSSFGPHGTQAAEDGSYPYQHIREIYSYETLDFSALFDEVSESSGRKLWRKLPFVKKKSDIDVRRRSVSIKNPSPISPDRPYHPLIPFAADEFPPQLTRSTVASSVSRDRSRSTSFTTWPSSQAPASTRSKSVAFPSPSTEARHDSTQGRVATKATEAGVQAQSPNPSNPLPEGQPGWRRFIPTRAHGGADGEPTMIKPVRTASGHRVLQLQEAVYDAEGKIVYKPLMLSSMHASDATRLFLLPMSSSGEDVVCWGSPQNPDVLRGDVCVGRDIMGQMVNETVVWSRDGLGLEDIEEALRRIDMKGLADKA